MICGRKLLALFATLAVLSSIVGIVFSSVAGMPQITTSASPFPQTQPSLVVQSDLQTLNLGSTSQPVAVVIVVDHSGTPLVGATVQLWRYPEGPWNPQLAAQTVANKTGWASLIDAGLAGFIHQSQYIYYAVTAFRAGKGTTDVGNYDWSALTMAGLIDTRSLTLTLTSYSTSTSDSSAD